jgi:hypothetical protein
MTAAEQLLENGELRDTANGIEDATPGASQHRCGAISSTLDPDARPRRQRVGDLVDERQDGRHRTVVHRLPRRRGAGNEFEPFAIDAGSNPA